MSDDKYNIEDIVTFSALEKPINVKDAVNDVMLAKIQSEIEVKKLEVAKSIFGGDDDEEDEFEDDEEDDDDDFDISDEDLDDLFNDLEDLADTDLEVEDEDGEDA